MTDKGHGTSGGVELTDGLLDQLAKEAEQGYDVARLGRGRRRGRPPIGEKAATIFQVRIEPELRELLEGAADAEETTPSDIVRRALRATLPAPGKRGPAVISPDVQHQRAAGPQGTRGGTGDEGTIMSSEDTLAPVIAAAAALPGRYDELKSEIGPALIRGDDYPLAALHRLEMSARIQFEAALALLGDRRLAYSAESHVRSLLEYMAHVAWVAGKDVRRPAGTAACRAICLDMGMTKELRAQVQASPAQYVGSPDTLAALDGRLLELQTLHRLQGCSCKSRKSSAVQATLRGIAAIAPHLGMFPWLYGISSLSVHLFLHDRMVREVGPGVSDFVEADDHLRAQLLSFLVPAYGIGLVQTLELEDTERARKMNESVGAVQSAPALRQAAEGDQTASVDASP